MEPMHLDHTYTNTAETELWVEKFRPKDYFDLLSDDVNLENLFF